MSVGELVTADRLLAARSAVVVVVITVVKDIVVEEVKDAVAVTVLLSILIRKLLRVEIKFRMNRIEEAKRSKSYTVSGVTVLTMKLEQSPTRLAVACFCPGWVPVTARRQLSARHPGGARSKRGDQAKVEEIEAKRMSDENETMIIY